MAAPIVTDNALRPTLALPVAGVRLRPWLATDAPGLAAHANDRGVWLNLRDVFPHPYTLADAQQYISFATRPKSPDIHLAFEVDGAAVGSISILFQTDVHHRSAEIGYWLGRAYWGRGIATAAVRALSDYTFAHFDVCRLYASIFARNAGSARVLEKAGYALEGRLRQSITKDGETLDALLFALLKV
ncbi:Protein N-acetyltransferase, RimJ/RimL family [Hymenobacter daecheongensis DSM 21074]|uniref:Protein N-acetyltransferase, RimJ/RimL family n=1 Tax=Hymenobacter daecheongensis DSM 21074 TaxID=1121955 RepID=A0A1M6B2T3_9BACT|nr:GNAT family N-acetyltransferase [Hymenobacter daecheongensis]SHI43025.1 Protein N-acetyltransferase, RimJ/RimL family [Hymenobacter daecheongensis DSM 21074]